MKQLIFFSVASCIIALTSCGNSSQDESPALGPVSSESALPWNRPTGPEGGGPLGGMLNRR